MSTITLSNWLDAKAALRNRDLRQGLYDEGIALMHGVIALVLFVGVYATSGR